MAVAIFGFLLQASVLVFAAWATYIGDLEKNGEAMPPWAFPLTLAGTVLLCTGMFLCAFLVERSTSERIFSWKGPADTVPPSIYWLQAGNQTIGDQTFDAFAHRSRPQRYTTSRKLEPSEFREAMKFSEDVLVWVAVVITMIGFILQFIGLRGMHSAVSLFQLGAMLIMALLRAGLRTKRLGPDENDLKGFRDNISGHELDWLVIQIGEDYVGKRRENSTQSSVEEPGIWEPVGSSEWANLTIKPGLQENEALGEENCELNHAARILEYRVRLARLTSTEVAISSRWSIEKIETRQQAIKLQRALEDVTKILFTDSNLREVAWKDRRIFFWPIRCRVQLPQFESGESTSVGHSVYLTLRNSNDGHSDIWNFDQSELEAVLGLWSWSLKAALIIGGVEQVAAGEPLIKRIFAFARTGQECEDIKTDLKLWVRRDRGLIKEEKLEGRQLPQSARLEKNRNERYFGWQAVNLPTKRTDSLTIISVTTNNSLLTQCAHDIFPLL